MKTAIKRENAEFLVITLKHVSDLMGRANRHRTQKLRGIAHENGYKTRKGEFLVITLKHISGLTVDRDRPGTPKSWAIAHENGHKTRKQ